MREAGVRDPARDRIFMIAVRDPEGRVEILEAAGDDMEAEADLIRRLVAKVQAADPDVIENHNLHGFDLPFLHTRARRLRVPLGLGRTGAAGLLERAARRGMVNEGGKRRVRLIAPGRELIDTLDAVRAHDFATRDLPGYGLKVVARHFGLAGPEREMIRGDQIHEVYKHDPARVRRYAGADVEEVASLARMFGGAAFALARMAPRRYERLADAGVAQSAQADLRSDACRIAKRINAMHGRSIVRPIDIRSWRASRSTSTTLMMEPAPVPAPASSAEAFGEGMAPVPVLVLPLVLVPPLAPPPPSNPAPAM